MIFRRIQQKNHLLSLKLEILALSIILFIHLRKKLHIKELDKSTFLLFIV